VVSVYNGRFRVVQRDVVLADIDQQVDAGARHITFGDPGFWNGVTHAVRIVRELHRRQPDVSYDVTIKVEHLLRDARHLAALADTGCLFVTTAVESFDDEVLRRLAKGHTAADFGRALGLLRRHGLAVHPTFIPFHPWTTARDYGAFLERIADYDLVGSVAPIQLALRLLVPAGSLLLDLPEMTAVLGPFDVDRLVSGLAGLGSRHDCADPAEAAGGVPHLLKNPGSSAPNRRPCGSVPRRPGFLTGGMEEGRTSWHNMF
jgi:Radical SAM superfamily